MFDGSFNYIIEAAKINIGCCLNVRRSYNSLFAFRVIVDLPIPSVISVYDISNLFVIPTARSFAELTLALVTATKITFN